MFAKCDVCINSHEDISFDLKTKYNTWGEIKNRKRKCDFENYENISKKKPRNSLVIINLFYMSINLLMKSHLLQNIDSCQQKLVNGSKLFRKYQINNGEVSDVVFIVGPNKQEILGYKQLLSLSNDVFNAQFNNQYLDKNTDEIRIPDLDPEAFNLFLQFLYFGEFEINDDEKSLDLILKIYEIGHRYLTKHLMEICCTFVGTKLNYRNIFAVMTWNELYEDEEVHKMTSEFLQENAICCLTYNSAGFAKLPKSLVLEILSWDLLNCSESLLLKNVSHWSRNACLLKRQKLSFSNIAEQMKDFLPLIRFNSKQETVPYMTSNRSPRKCTYERPDLQRMTMMQNVSKLGDKFFYKKKMVSFGFTLLLSNLKHKPNNKENIIVKISLDDVILKELNINIVASRYVSTTEILFDEPLIFEAGRSYKVEVEYEENSERMIAFDSNSSVKGSTFFLFEEFFDPQTHSIFENV